MNHQNDYLLLLLYSTYYESRLYWLGNSLLQQVSLQLQLKKYLLKPIFELNEDRTQPIVLTRLWDRKTVHK